MGKRMFRPCRYNGGVNCDFQNYCKSCGWNPEVSDRRLKTVYGVEPVHHEREKEVNHGKNN